MTKPDASANEREISRSPRDPASCGPEKSGMSRREFARSAALAAATAATLPAELFGRAVEGQPNKDVSQQPVEQPQLSAAARAEVEEKIQAILRRYGSRLSDAEKADIRRLVTEGQKPLENLRAFPLDNSDAPATVFKLYPDFASARTSPKLVSHAPARKGKV